MTWNAESMCLASPLWIFIFILELCKLKAWLLLLYFSAMEIKDSFNFSAIKQRIIHLSLGSLSSSSAGFTSVAGSQELVNTSRESSVSMPKEVPVLLTQKAALEWGPRRGVSRNWVYYTLTHGARGGTRGMNRRSAAPLTTGNTQAHLMRCSWKSNNWKWGDMLA